MEVISEDAFSNCFSLKVLRIPAQCRYLGEDAGQDERIATNDAQALDFYITPHLTTTRRRNKLLHALDACGKLYHNNNFKRNIDIEVAAGIKETFGVYSVPKTLLTSPALAKVNAIAFEDHLFRQEAFPAEFLPIIRFSDTQIAGRVVNADTDEAESLYASGQTRSGKSFFLVQQALLRRVVRGEPVIIFDQTGAFTPEELRKHLPADVVERYFTHYDLCKQGLPVDLLSLEGCDTLPEKKNLLFSLFSVAAGVTGDVQGKILRKCLTQIAKAIDNGLIESLADTLVFFQEEDPDQMMLRARLEEYLTTSKAFRCPKVTGAGSSVPAISLSLILRLTGSANRVR